MKPQSSSCFLGAAFVIFLLFEAAKTASNPGAGHTPYSQALKAPKVSHSPSFSISRRLAGSPSNKRKISEADGTNLTTLTTEANFRTAKRAIFPTFPVGGLRGYTTPPANTVIPEPTSNDSITSHSSGVSRASSTASTYSSSGRSSACSSGSVSSAFIHSTAFSAMPRNASITSTDGTRPSRLSLSDTDKIFATELESLAKVPEPVAPQRLSQEQNFGNFRISHGLRVDTPSLLESSELDDQISDELFDSIVDMCESSGDAPFMSNPQENDQEMQMQGVSPTYREHDEGPLKQAPSRAGSVTVALSEDLSAATLTETPAQHRFTPVNIISNQHLGPTVLEPEYKPWIPVSAPRSFFSESFAALSRDFDIPPFHIEMGLSDTLDTQEDFDYFPDAQFKPIQDPGELDEDHDLLQKVIEYTRPHAVQISEAVALMNEMERDRAFNPSSSSAKRFYSQVYKFIDQNPTALESQWLRRFIKGQTVDFVEYFAEISANGQISEWSVDRCKTFIKTIVPSIVYKQHFEEVFLDFITDFFLPFLSSNAQELMQSPSTRIILSSQFAKIAVELIKELVTPVIFEKLVVAFQPVVHEDHAELLYKALVETMKVFTVPEPFEPPEFEAPPQKPSKRDRKYKRHKSLKDREAAHAIDMQQYQTDLREYNDRLAKENKKNERKRAFLEEMIRVKKIHKTRSFEYLRILVTYFPKPIMRPDSQWITGVTLKMDRPAESPLRRPVKPEDKTVMDKVMGPEAHDNQDFFDALFFARILRACLILDHSINLVAIHLDPYLKASRIGIMDSPIGFRYLLVIDKFLKITRFNVVANVLPHIINYRRYLLTYLIRNGALYMGIEPNKVQSRSITLELHSLFESIYLYQMFSPTSPNYHADRLKLLMAISGIDFHFPVIYFTYNPVSYETVCQILRGTSLSVARVNAYREIFAALKNVQLLPIYERKVLKFKNPPAGYNDGTDRPFRVLENHNQDLHLRNPLSEDYEAVYNWSMPRALKVLTKVTDNLNFPYALIPARALLARRFGISFDASNYLAQMKENFTWLEAIDFANFFLEREAQILISRANSLLDANLYQVYRIQDPQKQIHLHRALPFDENTYHIVIIIERAFSQMDGKRVDQIRKTYSRDTLFELYSHGLGTIDPEIVMSWSPEIAVKIMEYFTNPLNIPEQFDIEKMI